MSRRRPVGSFRYEPFRDGPDPLAAPLTATAALDDLTGRILSGQSIQEALRAALREGIAGRRGLADLHRAAERRRRDLRDAGHLDGVLDDLRTLLDDALTAERAALFGDPSDDARFREARLDAVPDQVGRAIRDLDDYDWRSPAAREAFDRLRGRLRRDVIDQQFRDLSHGAQSLSDPSTRRALADMLADLNEILTKHAAGQDTTTDYQAFLDRHLAANGGILPDAPATLAEFVDDLARRAAAMQRMLASMSPSQRTELTEAMRVALDDLDLQAQMAALTDTLRTLRPEFGWDGTAAMRGERSLDLPSATDVLADLADAEALTDALGDALTSASPDLAAIDEAAVERALGRSARDDLTALTEARQALVDAGYVLTGPDELRLSPKAIRRIGRTALSAVFDSLDATARGEHAVHRTGTAGEPTGQTRPWEFGDEQPIDPVRTVRNAAVRRLMHADAIALTAEDFEVHATETTTRAAVALLVDRSYSMAINDTWRDAKTMALALHTLGAMTYPLDAMQIIAFADVAGVVHPADLPNLEVSYVQGTNLQHALLLAGQFLDRHRSAHPIVLVVTDGEPTAHVSSTGEGTFCWPPDPETIARTVAEVDAMTRRRVPISWFRLGDDPGLARFVDAMAHRNGGRVLTPAAGRIGDVVVTDYVRARTRFGRR